MLRLTTSTTGRKLSHYGLLRLLKQYRLYLKFGCILSGGLLYDISDKNINAHIGSGRNNLGFIDFISWHRSVRIATIDFDPSSSLTNKCLRWIYYCRRHLSVFTTNHVKRWWLPIPSNTNFPSSSIPLTQTSTNYNQVIHTVIISSLTEVFRSRTIFSTRIAYWIREGILPSYLIIIAPPPLPNLIISYRYSWW